MITKKIKINNKNIDCFLIPLLTKNLIVLKASKGFIMCGYLNMSIANKFADTAAKIVGVKTIEEALATKIVLVSAKAKSLGLYKGQKVKDALKILC